VHRFGAQKVASSHDVAVLGGGVGAEVGNALGAAVGVAVGASDKTSKTMTLSFAVSLYSPSLAITVISYELNKL
jgi:ABC-type nitrate/sulfonate/bicarbonate transport system permease component